MATEFTEDHFELMGLFLRTETHDLASLDAAIAKATDDRDLVQLEHDLYDQMKTEALDEQNALLVAKAAELNAQRPEFIHIVEYLAGHPSIGGGTDPTQWRIYHEEQPGPVIVVDFDHSQATAELLAAEEQWNVFHDLQINDLYGTKKLRDGAVNRVNNLTKQRAAIKARNAHLREIT
ncbi:MAG TPA: hypothetical protein VNN13_09730 [Methylomirabilota bacterium]|nr:hypothetical protein [Methylomirabilota bacterium]